MPGFADNRPAPAYSLNLQRFLIAITQTHPFNEDKLWVTLFRELVQSFDGKRRLLEGEFAEFVPLIDRDAVNFVVKLYDEALVSLRYADIMDVKRGIDPHIAPVTSEQAKRVLVSPKAIDALEKIWETYYGTPHEEEKPGGGLGAYMPYHCYMIAHLLNWTLRLEWSGVNVDKIKSFEEKWRAVKNWPDSGIMGVRVIKAFLTPSEFGTGFDRTHIKHDMPIEMKKRLYLEALEYYNTRQDPNYFGHYNPVETHHFRGCTHHQLAKQVIVDEKEFFDSKFKVIFQPYYDAVPTYKAN